MTGDGPQRDPDSLSPDGGSFTARSRVIDRGVETGAVGGHPDDDAGLSGVERSRRTRLWRLADQVVYALFSRHADRSRHARDRRRYRGTDLRVAFDLYLARTYGLSWAVGLVAGTLVAVAVLTSPTVVASLLRRAGLPAVVHPSVVAVGVGVATGAGARWSVVRLGGLVLRWRAEARRVNVERTLPGAVRYLHVLSTGSDGQRAMLAKVADTGAYGETAVSFRKVLNAAATTGNLGAGLGRVARDTPSRGVLAPFLLKFREHASQGPDALTQYLQLEGRMLGLQQDRARKRAEGFLELLAELFIVLLVLPALLVIVLTVMSVIAPGLSAPVPTPFGPVTVRGLIVSGSAAFILVVGLAAAALVSDLRPPDQTVTYDRPPGALATLTSADRNPASATPVVAAFAVPVALLSLLVTGDGVDALLAGYVAFALPVGAVAFRRARLDDAKDREMKDFVHAVSGHVTLGRPFSQAVELVARDVDFGPLNDDVADLALNLSLTSPTVDASSASLRTAALDRFTERVGTPLAAQSVGLVTGALESGSDTAVVFETLQAEIGRLYHETRALRSALLVYVAVGWTTALLVVGITVAVSAHVFDGFAQLSSVSSSAGVLDPQAVDLARDRGRIYVVTQATMLASGIFAGTASRGRYEALLHSGLLIVVCHVAFVVAGVQ